MLNVDCIKCYLGYNICDIYLVINIVIYRIPVYFPCQKNMPGKRNHDRSIPEMT